jgi:hypothetical protein
MLIDAAAFFLILLFGLYLLVLAALLVFSPERGKGFLLGFASSALTHYLELGLRIIVGAAFVVYSPKMLFPTVFLVFGWMLIGTSAVLALMPWQWHNQFAKISLPRVLKYPKFLAAVSAAMAIFVIFCLFAIPTGFA